MSTMFQSMISYSVQFLVELAVFLVSEPILLFVALAILAFLVGVLGGLMFLR